MNDPARAYLSPVTLHVRAGALARHPHGWVATLKARSHLGADAWDVHLIVGRSDHVITSTETWTVHADTGGIVLGTRLA